jgi:hypothetical protein
MPLPFRGPELAKANAGLSSLNTVLSIATPGPLKLTYKWQQATFEGWRKSNKALEAVGKQRICDELMFPVINQSLFQTRYEPGEA